MIPMMINSIRRRPLAAYITLRSKTTAAQYVESRARDAVFEKFMDKYKNLLKVIAIQDLILSNPTRTPPSVSLDFLNRLSQKLHLNRGAASFLRRYPHIFDIYYERTVSQPFVRLTDVATQICREEAEAITATLPAVVDRLILLLSMSKSKSLPLRAIFKVWKELGLPDDFEDSVICQNPHIFSLQDAHEPHTHILKLVDEFPLRHLRPAVEDWRVTECSKEKSEMNSPVEMQYCFKHQYPSGMRLSKNFRAKVKEWQSLPYMGPYEELREMKPSKVGMRRLEKRAVAIAHEFLSLTVEKTIEVEKISHFRKWFEIELNMRDLFLDHPGIFYLSTKGKRHTVFLREAYERGRLINPNPVYNATKKSKWLKRPGNYRSPDMQRPGNFEIWNMSLRLFSIFPLIQARERMMQGFLVEEQKSVKQVLEDSEGEGKEQMAQGVRQLVDKRLLRSSHCTLSCGKTV